MTACARIINVTCHSTVDGLSDNSIQVRAQAVAMATKQPELQVVGKGNPCLDAHSS